MLMAALDGILTRAMPGDPLDKDIYDLEQHELDRDALDPALAERSRWTPCATDHEFLLKGDVFHVGHH